MQRGVDEPLAASSSRATSGTLLADLWETQTWRLFPLLLLAVVGGTVLVPFVPSMMTDFFASRRAGQPMHCEGYAKGQAPAACQDAHADAWAAWTSFASQAVVSLLCTPAIGAWSDMHGRRPFLLAAELCGLLPLLILLLHINTGCSLLFYYAAQVLSSSISSIAVALAYLADRLAPQHRAGGFGLLMAVFSVGMFIGPVAGAALRSPAAAGWVALGAALSCVPYTLALLPESLSEQAKQEARRHHALHAAPAPGGGGGRGRGADAPWAAWRALSILLRSPLFRKLTLCMMLTGLVMEGIQDMLLQYLQLKLDFRVNDQAGGLSTFFRLLGIAFATQKWEAYAAVSLGTLGAWAGRGRGRGARVGGIAHATGHGDAAWLRLHPLGPPLGPRRAAPPAPTPRLTHPDLSPPPLLLGAGAMSFPTISSIKSNNAKEHEQGSVQGALFGARALASGIGPLLFAQLFPMFTRTSSSLPYFPGAPFVVGAVLALGGVAVACAIPVDAGGSAGSMGGGAGRKLPWCSDEEEGSGPRSAPPGGGPQGHAPSARQQQRQQQQHAGGGGGGSGGSLRAEAEAAALAAAAEGGQRVDERSWLLPHGRAS
eukprot:scaffold4.g4926.t1